MGRVGQACDRSNSYGREARTITTIPARISRGKACRPPRYGTGGDNPCPSNEATLCTIVWDIKGYCDFVAGAGHKYDPDVDGFPSFLYSGATVTIKEVDFTVTPNVITTYD